MPQKNSKLDGKQEVDDSEVTQASRNIIAKLGAKFSNFIETKFQNNESIKRSDNEMDHSLPESKAIADLDNLISHLKQVYQNQPDIPLLLDDTLQLPLSKLFVGLELLMMVETSPMIVENFSNKKEEKIDINDNNSIQTDLLNLKDTNLGSAHRPELNEIHLQEERVTVHPKEFFTAYGEAPATNRVYLTGGVGTGKTLLNRYLLYLWASDKNFWSEFQILLYFPLKKLILNFPDRIDKSPYSLKDILLGEWDECALFGQRDQFGSPLVQPAQKEALWNFIQAEPEKVLFLLDGYDEIPTNHALTKGLLKFAPCYLLTSRPITKPNTLTRQIENVGFSSENRRQYIDQYLTLIQKPELASLVHRGIEDNPRLSSLSRIPVNCELLCSAFYIRHQQNLPLPTELNLTQLYTLLMEQWQRRALIREEIIPAEELRQYTSEELQEICGEGQLLLGELCYHTLCQTEGVIISGALVETVIINALNRQGEAVTFPNKRRLLTSLLDYGLLKRQGLSTETNFFEDKYDFVHLSFVEYLAGDYLAQGFASPKQNKLFNVSKKALHQYQYVPRFELVWWFVAGRLAERNQGGMTVFFYALCQAELLYPEAQVCQLMACYTQTCNLYNWSESTKQAFAEIWKPWIELAINDANQKRQKRLLTFIGRSTLNEYVVTSLVDATKIFLERVDQVENKYESDQETEKIFNPTAYLKAVSIVVLSSGNMKETLSSLFSQGFQTNQVTKIIQKLFVCPCSIFFTDSIASLLLSCLDYREQVSVLDKLENSVIDTNNDDMNLVLPHSFLSKLFYFNPDLQMRVLELSLKVLNKISLEDVVYINDFGIVYYIHYIEALTDLAPKLDYEKQVWLVNFILMLLKELKGVEIKVKLFDYIVNLIPHIEYNELSRLFSNALTALKVIDEHGNIEFYEGTEKLFFCLIPCLKEGEWQQLLDFLLSELKNKNLHRKFPVGLLAQLAPYIKYHAQLQLFNVALKKLKLGNQDLKIYIKFIKVLTQLSPFLKSKQHIQLLNTILTELEAREKSKQEVNSNELFNLLYQLITYLEPNKKMQLFDLILSKLVMKKQYVYYFRAEFIKLIFYLLPSLQHSDRMRLFDRTFELNPSEYKCKDIDFYKQLVQIWYQLLPHLDFNRKLRLLHFVLNETENKNHWPYHKSAFDLLTQLIPYLADDTLPCVLQASLKGIQEHPSVSKAALTTLFSLIHRFNCIGKKEEQKLAIDGILQNVGKEWLSNVILKESSIVFYLDCNEQLSLLGVILTISLKILKDKNNDCSNLIFYLNNRLGHHTVSTTISQRIKDGGKKWRRSDEFPFLNALAKGFMSVAKMLISHDSEIFSIGPFKEDNQILFNSKSNQLKDFKRHLKYENDESVKRCLSYNLAWETLKNLFPLFTLMEQKQILYCIGEKLQSQYDFLTFYAIANTFTWDMWCRFDLLPTLFEECMVKDHPVTMLLATFIKEDSHVVIKHRKALYFPELKFEVKCQDINKQWENLVDALQEIIEKDTNQDQLASCLSQLPTQLHNLRKVLNESTPRLSQSSFTYFGGAGLRNHIAGFAMISDQYWAVSILRNKKNHCFLVIEGFRDGKEILEEVHLRANKETGMVSITREPIEASKLERYKKNDYSFKGWQITLDQANRLLETIEQDQAEAATGRLEYNFFGNGEIHRIRFANGKNYHNCLSWCEGKLLELELPQQERWIDFFVVNPKCHIPKNRLTNDNNNKKSRKDNVNCRLS